MKSYTAHSISAKGHKVGLYVFPCMCVSLCMCWFVFITKMMSGTYVNLRNNNILLWTLFDIPPLISFISKAEILGSVKPERKTM